MPIAKLLISLIIIFTPGKTLAQKEPPDSFRINDADTTLHFYEDTRKGELLLYNGAEYSRSYRGTTGSPYFLSFILQDGFIVMYGVKYGPVPMAYDLVSNEVIIKDKKGIILVLPPQSIDSFYLNNHLFLQVRAGASENRIEPAFYDVVHYNTATVLIRHEKKQVRPHNSEDPDFFREYNSYYLKVNDQFFKIENNSSLAAAFGNKQTEIKSFLRQNRLNFKNDKETTLLQTAAYYAGLNK